MSYRQFIIPAYHEFIDAFGVAPEPIDDAGAARLEFEQDSEVMKFTYDPAGRSVKVCWLSRSSTLVEIFREGATSLRLRSPSLRSPGDATSIIVDFEVDEIMGKIEVGIFPKFSIRDELLFH